MATSIKATAVEIAKRFADAAVGLVARVVVVRGMDMDVNSSVGVKTSTVGEDGAAVTLAGGTVVTTTSVELDAVKLALTAVEQAQVANDDNNDDVTSTAWLVWLQ